MRGGVHPFVGGKALPTYGDLPGLGGWPAVAGSHMIPKCVCGEVRVCKIYIKYNEVSCFVHLI